MSGADPDEEGDEEQLRGGEQADEPEQKGHALTDIGGDVGGAGVLEAHG